MTGRIHPAVHHIFRGLVPGRDILSFPVGGKEQAITCPGVTHKDEAAAGTVKRVVRMVFDAEIVIIFHVPGVITRGVIQVGVALERRHAGIGAFLVDQFHHALFVGRVLHRHVDPRAAGEIRLVGRSLARYGRLADSRVAHHAAVG